MSHLPNMFKSPETGFTSYLLHIGAHGAAVVYKLGKDGSPETMVAGELADVIGWPIQKATTQFRIVKFFYKDIPDSNAEPADFRFYHGNWADLSKILNGKGIKTGEVREELSMMRRSGIEIPYIGSWENHWEVTELGKKSDAYHIAKAAKNGEQP